MNNIFKIPAFQRRKAIPKQLKDLELLPLNEQFSKLTMPIVSDDDMRPVMTGNFFDMESKKIVSTDAHKLTAINMPKDTFNFIAQKYNKELDKEPKGLIFHTLSQLQKDYNKLMKIATKNSSDDFQTFDEYVKFRAIEDGRYPSYEAVIPKEFTNVINVDYQKLYWYTKVLLDAKVIDDVTKINTSNENEYQNKKIEYLKDSYVSFLPYTKQIILTYTLDGKQEYIGFNARLVCDLLKFAMDFNGKSFGKVGISGNNRAMVVELENGLNVSTDSVGLVMPVMLVSGEFDNTIGDSDFDLSVAMYYDLDTNSIISDKENYPINESIGFMPNKAGLSTPNIRVKEEVSKVENSSADLIDILTRIKGYKIALKVAKEENKANIEKKIKGLEIAKRMKKDDLPFAKGGNVDEDISWDITIHDEYDFETFEINVRGYFENEEDAIKQAIKDYDIYVDESDYGKMYWNEHEITIFGAKKNYKKGGNVKNGINWYKYDGQYEAEFGNFFLYISPSTQRGYYNFRVTDGYRGDTISESQQEILGLDNAKELAIDIVGDYMKQFKKGGLIKEFNLREIKSLSIGNQKFLTDDINDKGYIYENGILYDVDYKDEAPHYKKGSSHRMSKIKVNIVNKMAKGGGVNIDINKYFNYSPQKVEEMLDYTDYKDEILFTKIAESDNFTYYYVLNELISNKDKKEQKYFAVYKPSGKGGDFEILNGVSFVGGNSFMPLQDEIHYGKLNYQHPLLKQIIQQDFNKMAKGGMVEFYDYKGVEIMYEPTYKEYYANDMVFYSLEDAHEYIDSGEANKTPKHIENLYRRGAMSKGGGVDDYFTMKDGSKMSKVEWYKKMEDKLGFEKWAERILKDSQFGQKINTPSNELTHNRLNIKAVIGKKYVTISSYTPNYNRYLDSKTFDNLKELDDYLNENQILAKGGGIDDDFADLYGGEVFLLSKGYSNPKEVYFQVEDSVIEVTQAQKGLKNIGIFYYTENFENQIDKQLLAKISSDFGNEFSITLYTNAGVDLHSSSKGKYKNIQVERLKGNYKTGGSVDEQTYIDLFEDYENIPAEVQMILDEYSESFEDGDYIGLSKAQNELEQIGYTFDFYVDGDAYGLRPMNVKLSQLQGYEDEDEE
jgi:hypothetical protein